MPLPDDIELSESDRDAIERALALDPDLEDELWLISAKLKPEARERFWRAFAKASAADGRPAGAVLAALERAAMQGFDEVAT